MLTYLCEGEVFMNRVNLDGKIIPILFSTGFSYVFQEQIDQDTGQVVFPYYRFDYSAVVDKLFNVYILPQRDGKPLYFLTDIVLAAYGNKEKIDLIEKANDSIDEEATFIVMNEDNYNSMYYETVLENDTVNVKEYIFKKLRTKINKEINLPDCVITYVDLLNDPQKLKAILDTAIYKDPDKVESTSCTDGYKRLPKL